MHFFFFLSCASALSDSSCLDIQCGSGITASTCIETSNSSISVYSCKNGFACDYSQLRFGVNWTDMQCTEVGSAVIPCSFSVSNQPTGLVCCEDSDCKSGTCTSNVCQGLSSGSSCSSSDQCVSGYYCLKSLCEKLKTLDSTCTTDDECSIGSACNTDKCTALFSVENGKKASNRKLCKSNFSNNQVCDYIEVYVGSTKLSYPYQCQIGNTCTYKYATSGDIFVKNSCLCGGNSTNIGYCGEYAEYTKDAMQMNVEISYTTSKCSGDLAHTVNVEDLYLCGSIAYDLYYKYVRYFGQLRYLNIFRSGVLEKCGMALELFDSNYEFAAAINEAIIVVVGFGVFLSSF